MSRGFIKTPEAIFAALLVLAMLYYLAEKAYIPTLDIERDSSALQDSILDMLGSEIRDTLETCDLRRLQYLIHTFQPATMESKIIVEQVSEIIVNSEVPIENQVLSFTYNFPTYTDENSVLVYSEEQDYLTNVDWVWFAVPVIIYNNLSDKLDYDMYFENVTLNKPNVVNNSLLFYWEQEALQLNLSSYQDYGQYYLANISVKMPFLAAGEAGTAYVLFAVNNTTFSQDYANITGEATGFNHTVMETIESSRGDVRFRMLGRNDTEKRLYLSYSMGTSVNMMYFPISEEVNNSNVNFTIYRDKLKFCTPLAQERAPSSRFYAVRKPFYNEHLTSIIELEMWYQWV